MPDVLTRLERADPILYLDAPHDAPPPAGVLDRIVATPPPAPRRRRRSRPVLVVLAAGVAAVALLAALLSPGEKVSLAERAYAATAPEEDVIFTVTATELVSEAIPMRQRTRLTMWQRGDRMHNVEEVEQSGVNPGHWRYEHDQKGGVFRTLLRGKVDAMREDDPGWKGDEGRRGFAANLLTVVDRFRAAFAEHRMRDDGETTFAGRPAHAYAVLDEEQPGERETFYLDPETSLPLGAVHVLPIVPPARGAKAPAAEAPGEMRITEVVDRYQRLPPTPEHLALLDAPAIDAAQR